jgi:tungstate transport system permease protein
VGAQLKTGQQPQVVLAHRPATQYCRLKAVGELRVGLNCVEGMYTPAAMIIAQTIVITPLIGTLAVLALRAVDASLKDQLVALGVPLRSRLGLLAREPIPGLAAAALAGFGRAIAEVGAAQMTGGNIEGQTRVLTTATMLEVGKGEFGAAFADVAVLLGIVAIVAGVALVLQTR